MQNVSIIGEKARLFREKNSTELVIKYSYFLKDCFLNFVQVFFNFVAFITACNKGWKRTQFDMSEHDWLLKVLWKLVCEIVLKLLSINDSSGRTS